MAPKIDLTADAHNARLEAFGLDAIDDRSAETIEGLSIADVAALAVGGQLAQLNATTREISNELGAISKNLANLAKDTQSLADVADSAAALAQSAEKLGAAVTVGKRTRINISTVRGDIP